MSEEIRQTIPNLFFGKIFPAGFGLSYVWWKLGLLRCPYTFKSCGANSHLADSYSSWLSHTHAYSAKGASVLNGEVWENMSNPSLRGGPNTSDSLPLLPKSAGSDNYPLMCMWGLVRPFYLKLYSSNTPRTVLVTAMSANSYINRETLL